MWEVCLIACEEDRLCRNSRELLSSSVLSGLCSVEVILYQIVNMCNEYLLVHIEHILSIRGV